MGYLFAIIALALIGTGLFTFTRASPAVIAQGGRLAGPILMAAASGAMFLTGRGAVGAMLLSGAVALWRRTRHGGKIFRRAGSQNSGRQSSVRTEWLDMRLDHDSSEMNGKVLKGVFAERLLGDLTVSDLTTLHSEITLDAQSRQLLEAYLESRFPGWRDDMDARGRTGQGAASGSGSMSKQEAYELLGLRNGATAAEIREAHRRLLKRLHPDKGGSAVLTARINEARDILLPKHTRNSPE